MSSATVLDETEEATAAAAPPNARWIAHQYYDPGFKNAVISDLKKLRQLDPGWDGYGAPVPSEDAIDAAIAFIHALEEHIAPRPKVVPMPSGAVQLEWVAGPLVLELEFEPADRVRYLRWWPEKQIADEDVFDSTEVAMGETLVKWFARQNG